MMNRCLETSLQSQQDQILTTIETMRKTITSIRNEYEILKKIFEAKVSELKEMKKKAEAQASRSRWMGWIFCAISAVSCACMFIPGVNTIAAVGLGFVVAAGGGTNVALQLDGIKVDELTYRI